MSIRRFKELAADALEIPPEVALEVMKLSLTGNQALQAINHRGILVYETSRILFQTLDGPVEVCGSNLVLAEQSGVSVGKSRWGMDLEACENYLLSHFRDLFYVEIYQRGVRLDIHVVKRTNVPSENQPQPPGNLVASSAAVIRDVLVRTGTAAVQSGDVVQPGDVLIYGWMAGAPVAASGIVSATIYAEGYGECAEVQQITEPTGRSSQSLGLRYRDGETVTVLGQAHPDYAQSRVESRTEPLLLWRKFPLPVEITFRYVHELTSYTIYHSAAEAAALAQDLAQQAAAAALAEAPDCTVLDVQTVYEHLYLDDGVRRVHAVSAALAEMGTYQQLSQQELAQLQQWMQSLQNELAAAP